MKLLLTIIFTGLAIIASSYSQELTFDWVKKTAGSDQGVLKVDKAGNVYVGGRIDSYTPKENYNKGGDSCIITRNYGQWGFLSKYDAAGNLKWAKPIPGSMYMYSNTFVTSLTCIAIDDTGNIFIAGPCKGPTDFDPDTSTFMIPVSSKYYDSQDIFIMKVDSSCNFKWAKRLSSYPPKTVRSIGLDAYDNIYINGVFMYDLDFDPGPDTTILNSDNGRNFILKLNSEGNFRWVRQLQVYNSEPMTVDASGNTSSIYNIDLIDTLSTIDCDPGPDTILLKLAEVNAFILNLDSNGNFKQVIQLQGNKDKNTDKMYSLKIMKDDLRNIYVTGIFKGTVDFDPGEDKYTLTAPDNSSKLFILKLDEYGKFQWVKQFFNDVTAPLPMSVDKFGNVYSTGSFSDTLDFNQEAGVFTMISSGINDIFITKLNNRGEFLWAKQFGGHSTSDFYDPRFPLDGPVITHDGGRMIFVDEAGAIYNAGVFIDTADFDPSTAVHELKGSGFYLLKLTQTNFADVQENDKQANSLSIYPNPSSNSITLNFNKHITNGRIKLINLLGQTAFEQADVNGTSLLIDIAGRPSGMYFIEVKESGNISLMQVVKE